MVQQTPQPTSQLSVYLCNECAGLLTCDKQQRFAFQYDRQWVVKKNIAPLSLSLPLWEDTYVDEKAHPFFTNLLPESGVREAIASIHDRGLLCRSFVTPRNDNQDLEVFGQALYCPETQE
jgi:HipA-like protein